MRVTYPTLLYNLRVSFPRKLPRRNDCNAPGLQAALTVRLSVSLACKPDTCLPKKLAAAAPHRREKYTAPFTNQAIYCVYFTSAAN